MTMIVAYAPRYLGEGIPNGHYSVFQDALFEESITVGINYAFLCRDDISGSGALPLLKSNDFDENAAIVEKFLEYRSDVTHFFVYEADLKFIEPISKLALRFPNIRFILNMMRADVPIATPASNKYRTELKKFIKSGMQLNFRSMLIPSNVKFLCETDSRSLLLQTLGVRSIGNFPTFSQFTRQTSHYEIDYRELNKTNSFKVFFPRAISIRDKNYFFKFLYLIYLLRSELRNKELEIHVPSHNHFSNTLIKSLATLLGNRQVISVELPLSEENYWRNFSSADLVVLIEAPLYMTQSSGKAIDALVAGTPVLATSGTYGAQECNRWIEGFPSFSSVNQLAQVLCIGKDLAPLAQIALREKKIQIHHHYSVNRALHFISNL